MSLRPQRREWKEGRSLVLVCGVLLILRYWDQVTFPWTLWCPWFGYVLLSLSWGGVHWRYNIQDPLQMLAPLIVGLVASFSIRTEAQLERLMRAFTHCLWFIAAVFVFFWYGPGAPYQGVGQGYCVRPAAMTVSFIGCLYVARLRKGTYQTVLTWAACLAIAVLSGSRMATLVLLVVWLIAPSYRRVTSRIVVSAVICLLGLALFYSPLVQDRFFPEGHGTLKRIGQGDFSGSGRFDMWPVVWDEAQRHIAFGAGAGEVGRFMPKARLFNPEGTPLNDYLRVVFDYGVAGIVILVSTLLLQMYVLVRAMLMKGAVARWALSAAYLGLAALLLFALAGKKTGKGPRCRRRLSLPHPCRTAVRRNHWTGSPAGARWE